LTKEIAAPVAKLGPQTLILVDDRVFGRNGETLARRFARRALRSSEVRSLALDPSRSTATLAFHAASADPADRAMRLAHAVGEGGEELEEVALPRWPAGEPVTLHRHGDIISLVEILSSTSGRLLVQHPMIGRDPTIARQVEETVLVAPGVIEVTAISAKAQVRVRFNPRVISSGVLIRLVEAGLFRADPARVDCWPGQVNFAPANVSLGFAATGEFVLPIVTPVTAGMLVLSNLETFRAAAHQAREGKFGLPALYTSVVGATLVSGSTALLGAALMTWFFRYWEQRYRQDLATESRALLDKTVSLPEEARILTADGLERIVPSRELVPGQRLRARAGETLPADATVLAGTALLDETALRGTPAPLRRVAGDQVLAGSRLLTGTLDLEVARTSNETQAARISRALTETTLPAPQIWALNQDAESFASRAVAPTLLAAGAGLAVGGASTALAILRPDYATGIGLAVPLETLRDVKLAACNGIVVRVGTAFERLASTSWVLLEDHELLHHRDCDVSEIRANRLDEARLLLAAAAAGVWLGDERGPALARACRERGLIVRRAGLREIGGDGISADYHGRVVRLRGNPVAGLDPPPLLTVEFDGVEVAGIRFQRNEHPTAAKAVRRLQRAGLRVCLVSERAADATACLGSRLGVDRHRGDMHLDDKIRLLLDLRREGVAAVFVGDCVTGAQAACEAHLAIAVPGGDALGSEPWDVALLGSSIERLPVLFALAHDHTRRIERARYAVMAPNLLCVAGAFSLGLTGLAAVFISNFGTSIAYNNAMRSLRTTHDPVTEWRDADWYGGAATEPAWPKPSFGDWLKTETHHDQPAA
jgi:cation transport ATPase